MSPEELPHIRIVRVYRLGRRIVGELMLLMKGRLQGLEVCQVMSSREHRWCSLISRSETGDYENVIFCPGFWKEVSVEVGDL
jgi:hypothetical protein